MTIFVDTPTEDVMGLSDSLSLEEARSAPPGSGGHWCQGTSALQTLHKSSARAQDAHYFLGGINHDWVCYYERGVTSDQSCINEWNAMDSLESKRPHSPDSLTDNALPPTPREETQVLIRSKLKEIMMSVDIDEVTSKYIRQRLEEDLAMDLFKFKSYIDQEMLVILGQMDAATEIFPHVYLGSEWNASNLDELQSNGVGFILNVTKEIDNFYPGTFDYLNIRVYDDEKTELLRHWDRTFRYITQVKEKNSKVLVHCKMGISRSASVVIAYAMKAFNMSLDEALAIVKKKRSCIKPNQAFCSQLKTYEGILDASRQRHNILWRSKSETNLKSASGQANRHNNKGQQNTKSNDDVDQSNNKSLHKSTEELSTLDPSLNALIPTPTNLQNGDGNKRPKSWSPDDHTAALLFPQKSEKDGNYFGESWRRSQSLNVQSWRAHVTLQQRDLRDMAVEGSGFEDEDESPSSVVEALNPLYSEVPSDGITSEASSLQLPSTVKDIINEFENVQTGNPAVSKKSDNVRKGEVLLIQNTVGSSDDFDSHSSTAELDKVIETLLTPSEDVQGSEPVISQTKVVAQKHQAVLIPSQIWQEDKSEVEVNVTPAESPVGVLKESITWPAGIVKRQKQDFEEKGKLSDSKSPSNNKECEPSLSRQNSSSSLTGHIQRVEIVRSPSYGRQDSIGSDTVKRDDPFSAKLDKVFDREERKEQRLSAIIPVSGDTKDTPSRNSSWGSFDSAVVLADRDLPSRQSSWGSCDTRVTTGTASSRNSSFGPFDKKPQPLKENVEISPPNSNITGTYFEKETGPFTPGTIRRNKSKNSDIKDGMLGEEIKSNPNENEDLEDGSQFKAVANIKAYGPAPYKSPTEREFSTNPMEMNDEGMVEGTDSSFDHHHSNPALNICIPNSTNPLAISKSQPSVCTTISSAEDLNTELKMCSRLNDSKTCSVNDTVPTPAAGTVQQHKDILESKTQEGSYTEVQKIQEKLLIPAYSRSHSYCDLEIEKSPLSSEGSGNHNFSEKRAKFEGHAENESEKGKVRKITQAIEKQNEDEKMKQCKIEGIRKRSHSLERLSTSPSSPGSSQIGLLEQLMVQTQADVHHSEMEQSPTEEICVKNLVGKFEDCQEQKPPRVQTRNTRAKSDSCTPDKFRPPVPQRKSSLDYNFKPVHRSQSQPPQTPARQTTPGGSLSSAGKAPSHKPPPGGRGQACGTEVRQRKQQGKTHPLTKLTQTTRENYHTM
ncbi:Protein phosphatase Slingshot [Chionoecetes opilio]|uniref:protein-serine/threonine phosphatase n=1 Tax=Chionoecetes opilio TaxID=41210 RepID=A0A8J5CFF2_CHIOP|nr:Protein phosphatase Slingshot [Chionoecetes opilio]